MKEQWLIDIENPVVRDHIVLGRNLLPGLAYIDLIYQVFKDHGYDPDCLELRNLSIFEPLVVGHRDDMELNAECTSLDADTWRVTLTGNPRNELGKHESRRYATAEMKRSTAAYFDERIDIAQLSKLATHVFQLEDLYAGYRKQGVVHEDFMRINGRAYVTEHAIYVHCELSDVANDSADHMLFHPALIDGSAVCGGGAVAAVGAGEHGGLSLPLCYESFRAAALLQRRCTTRILRSSMRQTKELSFCTLEFFDEQGTKIAELKNLTTKLVRDSSLLAPQAVVAPRSASSDAKVSSRGAATRSTNARQLRVENWLRGLIAAQLECAVQRVDVESDYFELGLTSAGLLEFVQMLERKMACSLSPTLLFEHQNIAALAAHLLDHRRDSLPLPLEPNESSMGEETPGLDIRIDRRKERTPEQEPARSSESVSFAARRAGDVYDVAVIGISGRFPEAKDVTSYWENLRASKDCVSEIPAVRWDWRTHFDAEKGKPGKSYSRWGGFIEGVEDFDPLFFNIAPREAEAMDPQQRLFLETTWNALEQSGHTSEVLRRRYGGSVGVFIGAGPLYEKFPCTSHSAIANRVSAYFDLEGPSIVFDTMCSSGALAIHTACQALMNGDCRMAIAGAVNLSVSPSKYIELSQTLLLGSHSACRSFGGGDGYIPAEAVGVVLLKPLAAAIEDGDEILGVIKSTAVNHTGRGRLPNPNSLAKLIGQVCTKAQVPLHTVGYVEAAATGSALVDAAEVAALKMAFEKADLRQSICPIGSAKASFGHAEAASGIVQLFKVLLQLKHRELVPTHRQSGAESKIFENSPFRLQVKLENWLQSEEESNEDRNAPRRALINSFVAGGTNVCMLVEEYQSSQTANVATEAQPATALCVFSARDAERLRAVVKQMRELVSETADLSLRDFAYTTQVFKEAMSSRLAIVAGTRTELLRAMDHYLDEQNDADTSGASIFAGDLSQGPTALVRLMKGSVGESLAAQFIAEFDWEKLALLWSQGVSVPWMRLYGPNRPRRIELPTYPFLRQRFATWRNDYISSTTTPLQSETEQESTMEKSHAGSVESSAKDFVLKFLSLALKIDPESINVRRELNEYGLDSIANLHFVRGAKEYLRVDITNREMLEHRSAERLIAMLTRKMAARDANENAKAVATPESTEVAPESSARSALKSESVPVESFTDLQPEQAIRVAAIELNKEELDESELGELTEENLEQFRSGKLGIDAIMKLISEGVVA